MNNVKFTQKRRFYILIKNVRHYTSFEGIQAIIPGTYSCVHINAQMGGFDDVVLFINITSPLASPMRYINT